MADFTDVRTRFTYADGRVQNGVLSVRPSARFVTEEDAAVILPTTMVFDVVNGVAYVHGSTTALMRLPVTPDGGYLLFSFVVTGSKDVLGAGKLEIPRTDDVVLWQDLVVVT